MTDAELRQLHLRSLLEAVCRSVRWTAAGGAPVEERLSLTLRALELRVAATQGELVASVCDDLTLRIRVKATRWSPALEAALHDGVKRSGSPLAELVLLDWPEIQRGGRTGLPDTGGWDGGADDGGRSR